MDQNSAFVSHLGEVIRFNLVSGSAQSSRDSEASIFSEDEKEPLKLQATSFRFSPESRSFEEKTRSQAHLRGHKVTSTRIMLVKCVRESTTGLVLPCILIQSQRAAEDFLASIFLYEPSSKKIFLLGVFTSKHAIPADKVWLTDGPSACWRVNEMNTFLLAWRDSESGKFRVDRVRDSINPEENMYCSMRPENDFKLLTIPRVKDNVDGDGHEWRLTHKRCDSKHIESLTWTSKCVPHVYTSISHCILLEGREQQQLKECRPQSTSSTDLPEMKTVYLATSMKQLLQFRNGGFCRLASIPFDDAVEIVSMETRGEKMLIVRSKGGGVCVISCSSFQVIQEWKGVSCLHIGDILGNGRDQLLMLLNFNKDTAGPQPFPEFILTDLDLCLITSSDQLLHDGKGQRSDDGQGVPTPQSLITAMQALEAKVENGLTSLWEQEMNRRMKDRIISQSMDNLTQMATGISDPVQRQPMLVQLFGASSSHMLPAQKQGSRIGGRLKVTNGWQRIVNEKWVIGCKVTNEGQWAASDVKLLVIPHIGSSQESVGCEGFIQHPSSRDIIFDSSRTESKESYQVPPSKRTKLQDTKASNALDFATKLLSSSSSPSIAGASSSSSSRLVSPASPLEPGRGCDVVATTSIPEFLEGPTASRLLVLQWMRQYPSTREDRSEADQPKTVSVICGQVHLDAADVLGSKLAVELPKVDSRLDHKKCSSDRITRVLSGTDELAMDASQLSTNISVTSRYTPLSCLQSVLMSRMGFLKMGEDACLCNCTRGVLRGMRVYLRNVRSKSAQLRVCMRDKRNLMLFFHTLKSNIPVDVIFNLDTPIEHMEEAIKHCVSSMNTEFQHVKKITDLASSTTPIGVSNHERDEETPMEQGDDHTHSEQEKLKRLREHFLMQQQAAKSKEYSLAGEQSESLRMKMLNLRENTDRAVTVLSKCIY